MSIQGKLLVVSDWLINCSLKFYSRIAPPFAKGGGAIVEKIQNIAGRLPENSRNRFVDRQSKKQ